MDFHDSAAVKDIVPAAAHADTFGPGCKFDLIQYSSQVFVVYISELNKINTVF